jgi:hypothetical protein
MGAKEIETHNCLGIHSKLMNFHPAKSVSTEVKSNGDHDYIGNYR